MWKGEKCAKFSSLKFGSLKVIRKKSYAIYKEWMVEWQCCSSEQELKAVFPRASVQKRTEPTSFWLLPWAKSVTVHNVLNILSPRIITCGYMRIVFHSIDLALIFTNNQNLILKCTQMRHAKLSDHNTNSAMLSYNMKPQELQKK